MIYQLNDDYIDLAKLEYISTINYHEFSLLGGTDVFYFEYIINGNRVLSLGNEGKNSVKIQRNDLINAWKEYKEQK